MHINQRGEILNDGARLQDGQGFGLGADLLAAPRRSRLDPGFWKPYIDERGRTCVDLRTGRFEVQNDGRLVPEVKTEFVRHLRAQGIDNPVWNAFTLRKDQWIQMQTRVVAAIRQELTAWDDLTRASSVAGFNAWAKLTWEYQASTDPGEAVKDMDLLTDGRNDRPQLNLRSHPLPVTHSDFYVSDREQEVSDGWIGMQMVDSASRRCAELVENTLIGTVTGMTFGPDSGTDTRYTGTSTEYGYLTLPSRIVKNDLTTPTGSNPEAVVDDVLEMIETLQSYGFYGPYTMYHSTAYTKWLNSDYFRTGSTLTGRTLRQRLLDNGDLTSIRRLNFLTSGYRLILVQMDPRWMSAINGMDFQVMRYDSKGGLRHNFIIAGIQTPLFTVPYAGVAPIVDGSTS